MKKLFIILTFVFSFLQVTKAGSPPSGKKLWSVRMAESIMKRYPQSWMLEGAKAPKWGYTPTFACFSFWEVWQHTGDRKFRDYVGSYCDSIVLDNGTIKNYKQEDYSIDNVNGGKVLFCLYNATRQEKYATAIRSLRDQMRTHPRTSEGGFWHKKIYPNQMWLDGLYMASPFLAQYAKEFNEPGLFNDVVNQYLLISKHLYDPKTGLFFHGWDESHEQAWANKETGQSANFWGRGMGWYAMALTDVLDFLPKDQKDRPRLLEILNQVAEGISKYQDEKTGLWYQVLDQGNRKGNYLESSASGMFVYSLLKAVRMGYLDKKYENIALKGYEGILKNLIREEPDGSISLTNCCSVAGLGGKPRYRDGSFEYYVGEKVIDNDLKATSPFILASIEVENLKKTVH